MAKRSNTVLVTGAAGFIGCHLAHELLRTGYTVIALDDLSGGFRHNVPEAATFIQGSILDVPLLDRLFVEHQFQAVYHLAAYAAEGLSPFIRRFNYTNNVVGSANLINAAINHNVPHFVFTSSIAVYGHLAQPAEESLVPQPIDPYGIAKYAVELDLQAANQQFGLNYTIFRPHNVYGQNQNLADPYRNVIGIFMRQLMQHQPLTIFGDGTQQRAFTYVTDIVPAIASAPTLASARNQAFNIGGQTPYTVNQLAQAVQAAIGSTATICYLPQRLEAHTALASHAKLQNVFGPQPATPLTEGLQIMANWAKAQPLPTQTAAPPIEVDKNLPAAWRESRAK